LESSFPKNEFQETNMALMGKMGYGNFRSGFLLVAGGLNMKNCILLSSTLSCGQA